MTDSEVVQVAGDGLTGIYRAKPGVDLPGRTIPDHHEVEAYSWGALTSGVRGMFGWIKRALWLLLLPFAMANLAYWARLELGKDTGQARWGARAVRVAALILTVFLVLTCCVVAIDMVAWQCFRGASPGCSRLPDQLNFLVGMSAPRRMAYASAVPLLVLVVLWLLSRQSLMRYEEVTVPDGETGDNEASILSHHTMWRGLERTKLLQRLHLTVGMGTVVGFSGTHLLRVVVDGSPRSWIFLNVCLSGALAVVVVAIACVIHHDDVEHRDRFRMSRRLPKQIGGVVALAQVAVLLSHLLALFVPDYTNSLQDGDFIGHNAWFIGVFVVLTALQVSLFIGGRMPAVPAVLVVLFVVVLAGFAIWLHARSKTTDDDSMLVPAAIVVLLFWVALTFWQFRIAEPRPSIAWRGAGSAVMLGASVWVSLLFTSGLTIAGANYLNGPDPVSDLVSELPAKSIPSELALESPRWVAPGTITVRDAVVRVVDGQVSVTSGVIEVEELTQPSPGALDQELLGGGIVRHGEEGELAVDVDEVELQHACLVDQAKEASIERCSAEDPTFVNAGTLQVRGKTLHVDATRDRVLLEVADPAQKPIVVPQVLIWTPIMQVVWLVLVTAGGAWCLARFTRHVKPRVTQVTDPWVSVHDREAVGKRRATAALGHRAETLLDMVGLVTTPVALALILLSATGRPPWQLDPIAWTTHLAAPSMYLVLAMSAGLVLLGSRLRTSAKTRQAVGVIWDLTTFWPRAAHPLAPPCYAERVVPDLRKRVGWALDTSAPTEGVVILSGHSQGSLIVVSVAARLSADDVRRIRIITYGSQVRALYGRVFPQVSGPDAIGYRPMTRTTLDEPFPDIPAATQEPHDPAKHSLLHRLRQHGSSWVNLFRRTDPLGWRVFGDVDGDDDRVTAEVPPGDAGDPGPIVQTHSDYQHTPEYIAVVDAWVNGTPVPPAGDVVR